MMSFSLRSSTTLCTRLGQVLDCDVQQEGARLDAEPQVDQRVKSERGHVRLAPFSSLSLKILLVLNPSGSLLPLLALQLVHLNEEGVGRVVQLRLEAVSESAHHLHILTHHLHVLATDLYHRPLVVTE